MNEEQANYLMGGAAAAVRLPRTSRSSASARKAFEIGVEQFLARALEPNPSGNFADLVAKMIRRLAADQRADGIWRTLGGDAAVIEAFLMAIAQAHYSLLLIDEMKKRRAELSKLFGEALHAVEVLSRYCAAVREYEGSEIEEEWFTTPPDTDEYLTALSMSVRQNARVNQMLFDTLIPRSRKANAANLIRSHFARVLVGNLHESFDKPLFQLVADAMNIMFNLKASREMTAEGVRAAWRKRKPIRLEIEAAHSTPKVPAE